MDEEKAAAHSSDEYENTSGNSAGIGPKMKKIVKKDGTPPHAIQQKKAKSHDSVKKGILKRREKIAK